MTAVSEPLAAALAAEAEADDEAAALRNGRYATHNDMRN